MAVGVTLKCWLLRNVELSVKQTMMCRMCETFPIIFQLPFVIFIPLTDLSDFKVILRIYLINLVLIVAMLYLLGS